MHYHVVSYVKRKQHFDAEVSEAYKIYCEYSGITPQLGWYFDFWLNQLMHGKEFHVIDSNGNEILDQYLVTTNEYLGDFGDYYQTSLNEEEG